MEKKEGKRGKKSRGGQKKGRKKGGKRETKEELGGSGWREKSCMQCLYNTCKHVRHSKNSNFGNHQESMMISILTSLRTLKLHT